MAKKPNNSAFTLSLIALGTSILFFLFIPAIFVILGWTKLKDVRKDLRGSTKVILIIASSWLGIKVFAILAYIWLTILVS